MRVSRVSQDNIKLALSMIAKGVPKRDVASLMDVHPSVVTRWYKMRNELIKRKNINRRLHRITVVTPSRTKKSLHDCRDYLAQKTKVPVSISTLILYFIEAGLITWEKNKKALPCIENDPRT
jgi:hypothetical protein